MTQMPRAFASGVTPAVASGALLRHLCSRQLAGRVAQETKLCLSHASRRPACLEKTRRGGAASSETQSTSTPSAWHTPLPWLQLAASSPRSCLPPSAAPRLLLWRPGRVLVRTQPGLTGWDFHAPARPHSDSLRVHTPSDERAQHLRHAVLPELRRRDCAWMDAVVMRCIHLTRRLPGPSSHACSSTWPWRRCARARCLLTGGR